MQQEVKRPSRFKWNSVKMKLIAGMTAVALVPTISLSIISNVVAQNVVYSGLSQSTLQATEQANEGLTYKLQGVESQLNLIANNINFTEYYQNSANAKYGLELLNGTLKSDKEYFSVYFSTPKKETLSAPDNVPAGYDPTIRDWYKGAIQNNGKVFITEPYRDAGTNTMTLTLSQAVLDKNHQLVGVAAIDLDISQFSKAINNISIGEKGYMTIVGKDGSYISHPDNNQVGSKSITKLSLWNSMNDKSTGYQQYTVNGSDKFSAFSTNKITGWKFISTLNAAEIQKGANQIRNIGWMLTGIFALLSALCAYLLGKRMSKNIISVKKAIETASKGDFTVRVSVKTADEFKELEQSFNQMMEQLSSALQKVDKTSKVVKETSTNLDRMTREANSALSEVAISIGEISKGATLQADNVYVSAEQMRELSQQLDEISTITEDINNVSHRSMELSNNGLEKVRVLTDKASETKSSTNEVSVIVKDVEERMEEINAIVEVITNITDRTNLLSLNASIESAKAKEYGLGFAVVAREIRMLSDQSKESVVEIKKIVSNIKAVVKQAVEAMERTNEAVSHQDVAVKETEAIFTDILSAINELAREVEIVEGSVKDSKSNKDRISGEMDSITAVSQETAAATEEVSASAEQISGTMKIYIQHSNGLKESSEQLEQEIKKFKLN